MPERFEDSSKFRHKAAKQHPLYGTSNSSYGARPPMQSEMPQIWNGVRVRTAAPVGFAALLPFRRARRAQRRLRSRCRTALDAGGAGAEAPNPPGRKGDFTSKNPGALRDNGFVVAITKSKVHKNLDSPF